LKYMPNFSCGNKAQRRACGGGILLGDNIGGGAVMLRPFRSQCVRVWISTELPCVCVYI
jgi:hypothetical protein